MQAWLILVISLGVLAVAMQGIFRGWLPNGPKGYKQGEGVSRKENPVGFWFFFGLYLCLGLGGALYALRLLFTQT